MITQNLSTLKIHKLTQEQYNRELAAGRIDENAIYLTPDDGSDIVIDEVLSETSENPVQNKIVKAAIDALAGLVGDEDVSVQISTAVGEHEADTDAHITAAERTAWNNKVDKVSGKQLSTNDYTTAEKTKLSYVAEYATKDEALTSADISEVFGTTITVAEEVGFS